jgi:hypothetical protein
MLRLAIVELPFRSYGEQFPRRQCRERLIQTIDEWLCENL